MKKTTGFHRFSVVVVAATVALVWWGAAVTTEGVGMAVPDWPLSFGSINPEGWWRVPAVFLEHGHRLLASLVGFLTVILCLWAWLGKKTRMLRVLTTAALIAVILQGVLGGMRVLHISDTFAVFHGCLAQAFFCLLLMIAMMSSPKWESRRELYEAGYLERMRGLSLVLFGAVFFQLILGATIRHTHRFGLADDGILTTGGRIFPGFGDFDLLLLFSHKAWALFVALAAGMACFYAATGNREGSGRIRRNAWLIGGFVGAQVLLGISVIATGKSFWVTNFHVLNGLAVLAAAFVLAVKCFTAKPRSILLADQSEPEESGKSEKGAASGTPV